MQKNLETGEDALTDLCIREILRENKGKRKGRNPHTGDDLMLGARRVVNFKCSSVLSERLNGKG